MSKFVRNGSMFSVNSNASMDVYDELPVGTYTVKWTPQTGYFLETVDGYELSGKIYGDTLKQADRILNTFEVRTANSTGVLLSGEKGSGKTLLAKKLSLLGQEKGYPTIVINGPHCGEDFNVFIQTISQPAVIVFDEFEKVYDKNQQEALLTLLDGVYPSQKLFVITCNDRYRVNSHMMNRPGRIFYRIDYKGLDRAFITEYAEDNLKNQDHIPALCHAAEMFTQFNFDLLKAIIEEMNRYDESPSDAMKILNAKPDNTPETFEYTLHVDGVEVKGDDLPHSNKLHTSPLALEETIYYYAPGTEKDEDGDRDYTTAEFESTDLKNVSHGVFTFENKEGVTLVMRRFQARQVNWDTLGYAV
jgi:hypothetical protein